MDNWIAVNGVVQQGHRVASGQAADPRFPQGTIALQRPLFQARGVDLAAYVLGTINLAIAPHRYRVKQAAQTIRQLQWSAHSPAEDFSFFDCRLIRSRDGGQREVYSGLIYYPHPETKPEHFQAPDILEIMTTAIPGLAYGDGLILEVDRHQLAID